MNRITDMVDAALARAEAAETALVQADDSERKVTVCGECLTSSCWQGQFMCDYSSVHGTVEKTVAELTALDRENPEFWSKETIAKLTGETDA